MRPSRLNIAGPGDFLSGEFLRCIREKLGLVVASIAKNPGSVVVWSDVDIQFFDLRSVDLQAALGSSSAESDLLFQSESRRATEVNTGFFVCRCSPSTLKFFQTVHSELGARPEENEQMVINRLLRQARPPRAGNDHPLSWNYLPPSFYARSHGWPPPRKLALYHANSTKGHDAIGQKLTQFSELARLQRGGAPARMWSVLRRIPRKIKSTLIQMGVMKSG